VLIFCDHSPGDSFHPSCGRTPSGMYTIHLHSIASSIANFFYIWFSLILTILSKKIYVRFLATVLNVCMYIMRGQRNQLENCMNFTCCCNTVSGSFQYEVLCKQTSNKIEYGCGALSKNILCKWVAGKRPFLFIKRINFLFFQLSTRNRKVVTSLR